MRFHVLATDYDGTIAHHGRVDAPTYAALEAVRTSGRHVVLVTGRQLPDLQQVCPDLDVFSVVVAENGGLLYWPSTRETRALGEPPPAAFVAALARRGVSPLSTGQMIVATWQPHQTTVLDVIRELGLELQVVFNKGAVMVLPSGLNKATGLGAALDALGLSPHNAVGVGDAENDHAFLTLCECAVAVQNALPAVKERVDWVTPADHGAGVAQLTRRLLEDDLAGLAASLERHALLLGADDAGAPVRVHPYATPVLVAGTSGGGKSTLATTLLEALAGRGYQFCILDPEGDYSALEGVVALGDPHHAPAVSEVLEVLASPGQNASVNLLGVALADRPAFLEGLLPRLQEMRVRTGRPHWLVIDEAHHVLPAARNPGAHALPPDLHGVLLITVHADQISPAILGTVSAAVVIGATPRETLAVFASAIGRAAPDCPETPLATGEALAWFPARQAPPVRFRIHPPKAERRRHVRKYVTGELGPDISFYFRGPDGRLNLRVQNLSLFLQIADGVDDETWTYHLRRGDFSRWFRETVKDEELAASVAAVEADIELSGEAARAAVRREIEARYAA